MTRSESLAFDDDASALADLMSKRRMSRAIVSREPDARASLTASAETLLIVATAPLHFFVTYLDLVRNLHRIALIPCSLWTGFGTASHDERQSVIEIERDGRVGIDLKFGSITFKQEEARSYAVALVDVIVESGTRVQMEVKLAADPETESIIAVTERFRTHIVATLRATADTFDATTSHGLLFHTGEGAPG